MYALAKTSFIIPGLLTPFIEHTNKSSITKSNNVKNSIKRGEMFLPKFELLKIGLKDKEAIDASLIKLGLSKLSGRYWSASEANRNKAWCLEPQTGEEDYCNKTDALKVRPMFWVHF